MMKQSQKSPSSTGNGETIEDIRDSLDRIEVLLNRGQQLLYGDEVSHGHHSGVTSLHGNGYLKSPSRSVAVSYERRPDPTPPRPLRQRTVQPTKNDMDSPYHRLYEDRHRRNSGSALRSRHDNSHSYAKSLSRKRHPDEDDLSASTRARQIEEIKRESGKVPNFEDGIDDSDTAQNISIADLKERIRRELEEYARCGPLMHRRDSYQRQQRAATVPRLTAGPRSGSVRKRSVNSPQPPTGKPIPGKKPKRITAGPSTTTTTAFSPSVGVTASSPAVASSIGLTAARPLAARGASAPMPGKKRIASRPRPAAPLSRPGTASLSASRGNPAASQERQPFWERLYHDAAVQQVKRDQRVEQRRMDLQAAKARSTPQAVRYTPPSHSVFLHGASTANQQPGRESSAQRTSSVKRTTVLGTKPSSTKASATASPGMPSRVAAPRPSLHGTAVKGSRSGSTVVPAQSVQLATPVRTEENVERHSGTGTLQPTDAKEGSRSRGAQPYVAPLNLSGIKK